ncbi:MAG: dethiobiotin synthase [Myxococcota bacterium]|nr:dethiobiotin synthase [Myxococcota bacterium]
MKGLFITGVDTEVGKTVVSAALMAAAPQHTRYWKPVQTGSPTDCDTREVQRLAGLAPHRVLDAGARYALPASPHYAAAQENETIDVQSVIRQGQEAHNATTTWVVEGVGGLMVPLNSQVLLPALIKALELPCIVVASTRLGTINHTLLTTRQLEAERIPTLGILLVGDEDPSALSALQDHSPFPVLATLPRLPEVTPAGVHSMAAQLRGVTPITDALQGVTP